VCLTVFYNAGSISKLIVPLSAGEAACKSTVDLLILIPACGLGNGRYAQQHHKEHALWRLKMKKLMDFWLANDNSTILTGLAKNLQPT